MNKDNSKDYTGFLEALDKKILIGDGAMGTELQVRGFLGCPDSANIEEDNIKKVIDIHLDYLEAGSDIIQTNTFGANPSKLGSHKLEQEIIHINKNAVAAAAEAIEIHERKSASVAAHFIAGNIGPTGKLMEPSGELKYSKAVDLFSRQIEVLIESGVDLLLIETIMDINEALAAVEAARKISNKIPIACTLSFGANGVTLMGNKAEESAGVLLDAGCTVVGANCSIGSDSMLGIVKKIRQALPDARLIFQPNAGLPVLKDGKAFYNETPEIMADNMKKYLPFKPSMLGTCCGSTPAHIKRLIHIIQG
ncbi:MAG TPA: methionine synthase I, cobalamin-binding domain-containing protein [Actinobacteria bacterium]|nr:methionine synthase I, cobalamin-binding domain-containing protein [Actinomycetota bacterium]